MTKQEDCKGCPLYRTCPYTNIFETPAPTAHELQKFSQVPNGYIIEPPAWGERLYAEGETLTFSLVLFGRLIEQLPLIAFAFKRAFEYNVGRGKANLLDIAKVEVDLTRQSILQNGNIIEHQKTIEIPTALDSVAQIKIDTPLRLQENGKPLRVNEITAERFFISLAKRLSLLSEFHSEPLNLDFGLLKTQIEQIQDNKYLKWQDWTRYSSRQDQKMKLGGVIGQWQFKNLSPELAKLLYIGQWLHCGKNATFGLGKYQITNL
ncbi:CRISPR system precrRNA processing endoribonuclease RAMP protein Cas6 [uncultured Aggregatibacter sp.]|uniref:CRISPR system precrRNA processing endoribonuclease RAMP protein Cas6 n=1 Tax=uncultured Aggregatibacter sp. TaxID=470564 RepID=UPI0025F5909F|nr:CRISPR system precrRNA processing endoribonuclease RAMP protein Cas6 [uncultured Aggregatibacter sp.]